LDDESFELSNLIEELDTKSKKEMARIKIDFFLTFLGSVVLGGAVALFFF
jgi:hypothetical protein